MSKDSTTTTVKTGYKGLSDEEKMLVDKEIELATFTNEQLKKQGTFQNQLRSLDPSVIEGEKTFLDNEAIASFYRTEAIKESATLEQLNLNLAEDLIPVREQIVQKQFEDFKRNGMASQETKDQIALVSKWHRASGQAQNDASLNSVLAQLNAASEGGNFDDTREAAGIAEDNFGRTMNAFEKRSELTLPLENAVVNDNSLSSLRNASSLSSQLQSELQLQASSNRQQLTGLQGNLGLGLSRGINAMPGALAAGMGNNKNAAQGSITTQSGGNAQQIVSGIGAGIGGLTAANSLGLFGTTAGTAAAGAAGAGAGLAGTISGIGTGIAAAGTAAATSITAGVASASAAVGSAASSAGASLLGLLAFFSHSSLKTHITRVDHEDTLKRLAGIPINRWKYRGDDVTHIGPMAEEFAEVFGVGDGYTLNIFDVMGVLLSAIQGLDEEIKNGKEARFGDSNKIPKTDK